MKIAYLKTIIGFGILGVTILSFGFQTFAFSEPLDEPEKIVIDFFDDRLCPVCRDTKNFIESLTDDYPALELVVHPISDIKKLKAVADQRGIENYQLMAPTIFIGDNFFQFTDFSNKQEDMIINAILGESVTGNGYSIKIPFLDIEIDTNRLSLPIITIILASMDGLNICSIGALILVLTIVMVLNSKKHIFFYGSLFILTSATVYGILVFAWGKLFEFLVGQLEILRTIVGLAALVGGIYFVREFWRYFKYGPTCEMTNSKLIAGATQRLTVAFNSPGRQIGLLTGSVMFFAAVVTIVELPCSIGIPVAFVGILTEAGVSLTAYIFYILTYLFFFMLIEIVLFVGAMVTKKIWFVNSKMITWVTLASALVLFYLAFYYLFS